MDSHCRKLATTCAQIEGHLLVASGPAASAVDTSSAQGWPLICDVVQRLTM
ncbi:hypothetical protein PAMP_023102 [Pampus punctatissimus]